MEDNCHVMLIYRKLIPSLYLCGHSQMRVLAEQGRIQYRAKDVEHMTDADMQWADVILLGRLDSWFELRLVRWLHEMKKYLIYVIDDDLLNTPAELSSTRYYRSSAVQKQIREMIRLSDAVMSPSPILLERYADGRRRRMLMEEPAVASVPYRSHAEHPTVKIGFAGSVDRTEDLEAMLGGVLTRIKHRYGDRVQFEFFGAIPAFAAEVNARTLPYCSSYDEYRKQLNALEWDIGLAPMPDTDFHACKHYIKLVEYAASGCVGVFSDVMPYTRMKEQGIPAVFCGNQPQAWEAALCALIEHDAQREEARRRLCAVAAERFDVIAIADKLYAEHSHVFEYRSARERRRHPVGLYRWIGYGHRGISLVRMHGWRFPAYAAGKVKSMLRNR